MTQIGVTKLVFPRPYALEYEEEELDLAAVDEDQVVVKTTYSLISPGTELALYTGTHIDIDNPRNRFAKFPFYPGYAAVGEVVVAGSRSGFEVGDHVFTAGHHASYGVFGATDEEIVKLSDGVDLKLALFARIAEISMTSVLQSRIREGDYVAVLGMGLVGNLAAQLYAGHGAIPIGVDVVAERLELARRTNVQHVVQSGPDLREAIHQFTGGKDPDIVVEATGVPALVNSALELCRVHGQVILLGSTRGLVTMNVYDHIHRKGVSLIGAHASIKDIDGLPSSGALYREMLQLIETGDLIVEPFITHQLPSSQAKQGYELLLNSKDQALGVLLDWND
ncbi:zinc-binding alcohol dehydrogenase [Paenibacillus sp. CF384]|uniref:zinc-dependent alcohol dehydrogenase n=1 Tax=Paenibacillus sp. CF384 TaxID=1884382 RepID=UPI0008973E43|nr:zinc-binding alcohol dehydrogenase [Paenibacillus sp. CF384]SDW17076.1 2-desacetyl-2-hydroxyethyl bacteriochlorophyllide A dehydrogenase [Paenibacillus sp. CF384]